MRLRRIVLDIDKPIKEPSIFALVEAITAVAGVATTNILVNEIDIDVMGLLVIIEGDGFDFAAIESAVFSAGGVVHSIDQVAAGDYVPAGYHTMPKVSA